jgi:hypothetical protein
VLNVKMGQSKLKRDENGLFNTDPGQIIWV